MQNVKGKMQNMQLQCACRIVLLPHFYQAINLLSRLTCFTSIMPWKR